MTSVGAGALLVTEREPAAVYGSSWRTAQLTNGWMNRCTFVCLRFIPFCSKQRSLPSERERVSELDKHSTGEERNSSTGIWRERIQICVSIQENRKREREREMVGVCSRAVWVLGLVFHVKDNRIVPSHIHPKNCVSCNFRRRNLSVLFGNSYRFVCSVVAIRFPDPNESHLFLECELLPVLFVHMQIKSKTSSIYTGQIIQRKEKIYIFWSENCVCACS